MKNILPFLACMLASAAFAPHASAQPAFARQTGLACVACHQQHFRVLNNFGRTFKATGYTMMGAQPRIESEQLSIPSTINAAVLVKVNYQKDNTAGVGSKATGTPNGLGDGRLQFGDELSLFLGGRVADNVGFLIEGNMVAAGGSLLAAFKLPILFATGTTRLSVIPFTTDTLGVQYGYELSSGGVMRANRWAEHRRETSAVQYNADQGADGGAATGFALVAQNDLGFINLTKWAPSFAMGGNAAANNSYDMCSSYIRIAATPTVDDWTIVAGGGAMRGSSLTNGPLGVGPAAVLVDTRQTFFDLQAHGKIRGNDLGVYAQYASAPATSGGNAYNMAPGDRKAWTIGADYSMIPHTLSAGAAYRRANNGGAAAASGDNAITLTAVYDLYQNVALHFNYSQYSGSAHNAAGAATYLTTFVLEAAW